MRASRLLFFILASAAFSAAAAAAADEEPAQDEPAQEEEAKPEAAAPEPPAPPVGAVKRRSLPKVHEPEPDADEPAPHSPAPRHAGNRAAVPAPAPEPAPAPATWDPGDGGAPKGVHCAAGKTPALARINLVIHNRPRPGKVVLDSTPIVCDKAFCAKVGFSNRNYCPLGAEGTADRVACELLVLGVDPEDDIPGPHWMFQGKGEIWKHEKNPFLAFVLFPTGGGGTATVCNNIKPVVCNSIRVP